jgi:hypothetical protein
MPRKNPLIVRRNFHASLANNAPLTEQWRYTVPIGRAAEVLLLGAATVNVTGGNVTVIIGDATGGWVFVSTLGLSGNNYVEQTYTSLIPMLPNQAVYATTQNTGTTASDTLAWLIAIEYDMSGFE